MRSPFLLLLFFFRQEKFQAADFPGRDGSDLLFSLLLQGETAGVGKRAIPQRRLTPRSSKRPVQLCVHINMAHPYMTLWTKEKKNVKRRGAQVSLCVCRRVIAADITTVHSI